MDQATPDLILDELPDAAIIAQLRKQAQEAGESVIATFHRNGSHDPRYLVISDRGTCVLLDDHITIQTFNRELGAEEVAEGLMAEA